MQNDSWENQYLKKIYSEGKQPSSPAVPQPSVPSPSASPERIPSERSESRESRGVPQPSAPPRIKYPEKKNHSGGLGLFITSLILFAFVAAMLGFAASIFSRFILFETLLTLMPGEKLLSETNILVMGLDEGKRIHRSDTMMVVHLDPVNNRAHVISIPRDTIVSIPGRGLDKITHAYAFGGADLSRRTTEGFLNLKIPYYISIDLPGLEKLIDELGGVRIEVERRMYYVDNSQNLFVDLQPGMQRMSGHKALGYLRYRHDGGDLNRILRQQKFIKALATQMAAKENVLRSPQIVVKLFSFMDTNLNTREILGLALSMRKIYDIGQIKMSQVPGFDMMIDGVYYMKPDNAAVGQIVEEFKKGN